MIQWSAWGSCRANITGTSTTTTTSSSSSSTATSSSTSKAGQSTCRRARGSWFPKAWFIELAPDVGVARQQVVDHPAALGVEARDEVGDHRAGPGLLVLVDRDVVGRGPARLDLPVLELAGLGVEHGDAVAAVLREPEPVLRVHHAAPRRGDLGRARHLEQLHIGRIDAKSGEVKLAEVGEP